LIATPKVTVSDDRFEVRDGNLKLKDGVSLNFEEASKIELELTGTNGTESWTRSVQIEVDGVNEANTAVNDSFNVSEDGTLSIEATQLLGNDTDLDADTLRIVGVSDAEHGTVTLLENGQIEFKADANYSGPAKFSYTVTDAGGLTSTATVEVNVGAVADAANLTAANVSGLEDQAVALNLGASLVDTDGSEVLNVSIKGVPEGFSLSSGTRQADGSWSVAPSELSKVTLSAPKDFNGQVNLTVEATTTESSTGETASLSKAFSVDIADVNDNPYDIQIDNTTIVENAKPGEVVAKLSASDVDDKNLSFRVVGDNAKSFVAVGNELRITDQAKFSFADKPIEKVTVEVSDGRGGVATREIEIAISANSRAIVGTDGNDSIVGTSANDNISTGSGNDTVFSGKGNDTINSGDGNDWIEGGEGNDVINLGKGNDQAVGGRGADT
jgi:large repetitive protein